MAGRGPGGASLVAWRRHELLVLGIENSTRTIGDSWTFRSLDMQDKIRSVLSIFESYSILGE